MVDIELAALGIVLAVLIVLAIRGRFGAARRTTGGGKWTVGRIVKIMVTIGLLLFVVMVVLPWLTGLVRHTLHEIFAPEIVVVRPVEHGGARHAPPPPADHARVEAVVHRVNGVPFEPGRTRRYRLRDGYEALTMQTLEAGRLHMYCSETEHGPEGYLWEPNHRCVGGWISFSTARGVEPLPLDITYHLRWHG
jgi:hypothetical protein